jgi:TonB family protein
MNVRTQIRSNSFAKLLAAICLIALACPQARSGDIKMIANPGVRTGTISSAEIKRIFLLEGDTLDDGTYVEPVLIRGGSVHGTFLKQFLNTNNDTLHTYYGTQVFTGKSAMPKELGSDAEVVAYVARTKGALGYVSAETNTERVKTLEVVSAASNEQRKLIRHVEPKYPDTLQHLNIGGIVRLRFTVSPKGDVENVQVLGGNPILAEAAETAVRQWVYSPGHSKTTSEVSIPFDPRH